VTSPLSARRILRGVVFGVLLLLLGGLAFRQWGGDYWDYVASRIMGGRTTLEVLQTIGPAALGRLKPEFARAGIAYPPANVTLLALKEERSLELWARNNDGPWVLVKKYPVLASSGVAGPKLREGDLQVPEGIYSIETLNPNSAFHLSLRVDYPNTFDRAKAAAEGRTNAGGDIYIHGSNRSIGCLAMGDPAIEELFCLTAETGKDNVAVIIAPHDFRIKPDEPAGANVAWSHELYADIKAALQPFAR
jgi:hypothetical protein